MRKTSSQFLVIARLKSSWLIPSFSLRCSLEHLQRVDLEATFSEFDKVLSGNCDNTPENARKNVGKLVNVRSLSLRLANWILENSFDFGVLRIWF